MWVDLLHNKIIKDTATEAFISSAEAALPALVTGVCGEVDGIMMYEDHIADGFSSGGFWYYPLTVISAGIANILWVRWKVSASCFASTSPYSYNGQSPLDFELASDVPTEFTDKLVGRAISYDDDSLKINVRTTSDDPLILAGKYSQTFVDELARQITVALERAMSVKGLASSPISLELVFAPGTYMEHTSENVTYRRLLLVDGASQPRDFWVKWTRVGGGVAYTVSDDVSGEDVIFELGEDVAQKIREKEFRFLCSSNPSKYQLAMGKKMVTEWRDIIKRAIRRGEIEKIEPIPVFDEGQKAVNDQLEAVLSTLGHTPVREEPTEAPSLGYDDELVNLVRDALLNSESVARAGEKPADIADEPAPILFETPDVAPMTEEPIELFAETPVQEPEQIVFDEPAPEAPAPEAPAPEELHVFDLPGEVEEDVIVAFAPAAEPEVAPTTETEENEMNDNYTAPYEPRSEESIRREVEAKIRLEYEAQARARAEAELEKLRAERAALKEENERLATIARTAQAQREKALKDHEEHAIRAKVTEDRLRAELEAKLKEEARERDRLAEAARIAVEEQRRKEAAEREEAARREAERLAREEAARREAERQAIEAARAAEAERIRREMEERARAEAAARAREAEAAARAAAEREAAARAAAEAAAKAAAEAEARAAAEREAAAKAAAEAARKQEKAKALVSRHAKVIFRHPVDLNMINTIKDVVEQTLIKQGKENIHIHIKAYQESKETINLEILRLPEDENDLLVAIVKAIGHAKIGVSKIIVE